MCVCVCLHCLLIFLALPTLPTDLTASRTWCSHVNVQGVDIPRTVQCACSTVLQLGLEQALQQDVLCLLCALLCLSWRNNVGEGDLLFVAKEPNITDPRNLHLQRTKALTVPASLPPTDADMSHSNCDDSKFPESKGKEVLVKSNFYVKTFVERSNHHSEKPIFSFLINQRRLNTRSNRLKELKLKKRGD